MKSILMMVMLFLSLNISNDYVTKMAKKDKSIEDILNKYHIKLS